MSSWVWSWTFYARHVCAISLLAFAAWGWGSLALRSFVFESAVERTALRLGAGAVVLSTIVFLLGLVGLLERPWLFALVVLGAALGLAVGRPRPRASLGAILALVMVLPIALQAFYPPADWDATSYHLASARLYLEAHRLVVATYLRYPVFPQLQEMLLALALGTFGDVAAHGITFVLWLGTGLAILALGRRVGTPAGGVVALGAWAGSPTGFVFGTIGYVDIPLTFYVTLACLCCVIYAREKRTRWAGLGGLFVGAAAATKYSGLFFVAALAIGLFAATPRGARTRALGVYAALAAVICVPWYVRNAALSGDPLFPFLGRWLPNRFWNASDLSMQLTDLGRQGSRTLGDFALLWGRLSFNQGIFVGPEDTFSPATWIPLPLLLLARWRSPLERSLLLLALAFLCLWFFTSPSGRYLLPVLPLLCLGMGATLIEFAGWIRRKSSVALPAVLLAVLVALPGVRYAVARTAARGLPPVTQPAREAFIARAFPTYPLYSWLGRAAGPRARLYGWRDSPLAYYSPREFRGDWFGPARYSKIETALPSAEAFRDSLTAMGAGYLVVPWSLGPLAVPDSGITMVHADPGGRVFRVGAPSD